MNVSLLTAREKIEYAMRNSHQVLSPRQRNSQREVRIRTKQGGYNAQSQEKGQKLPNGFSMRKERAKIAKQLIKYREGKIQEEQDGIDKEISDRKRVEKLYKKRAESRKKYNDKLKKKIETWEKQKQEKDVETEKVAKKKFDEQKKGEMKQ